MRQSVLQNSTLGFYIFASDSTALATGKTGLTLSATLSKGGAAANAVSPGYSEIGNGLYWVSPLAAHRDTLGEIAWQFSASGAIIAPRIEKVVAVNDQVSAFGASTPTNVTDAQNNVLARLPVSGRAVSDATWTNALASKMDANLDVAISVVQAQITALNNLSAKANIFGALLLEIPDSGSRAYLFELVVKDDEDKLVNLDASPTWTLTNAAGTDRSSLITASASIGTGRYGLTITVGAASTANETLKLTASGTVSGETRFAVLSPQIVDYDSATQINTILTRIGTPSVSLAADIATRLPTLSYTAPDNAGIAAARTAAESADGKLSAGRLSRVDRLPDVTAGNADGLALVGSGVTVGGYLTGQDPATLLAGTVTKVSSIDSLLLALTEVVSAVTRFRASALSQAPSGSGTVASTVVDGFSTDGRAQLLSAFAAAQDDGTLDPAAPCIPVVSGTDWRLDFTAIGDLTGRSNLIFAMKLKASDADAAALVLIDKDGLKVTNGQVAGSAANGSIVVTDDVAGTGYVLVKAAATSVPAGQKRVGLKVIKPSGEVRTAELWRPCVTVVDGIVDATA